MTKETSKNASTRRKAPAKGDVLLEEHGFSESGQTFIITQLTRISADLNNFEKYMSKEISEMKSEVSDLKTNQNVLATNIAKLETKVDTLEKHIPTIWQILGAFALFSGVIITALKIL